MFFLAFDSFQLSCSEPVSVILSKTVIVPLVMSLDMTSPNITKLAVPFQNENKWSYFRHLLGHLSYLEQYFSQ